MGDFGTHKKQKLLTVYVKTSRKKESDSVLQSRAVVNLEAHLKYTIGEDDDEDSSELK